MEFIKNKRVMIMSLVDLEHCGFSYEKFSGELFMNGIDDEEAETPVLIMVNFTGGAVVTPETSFETLNRMKQDNDTFRKYVKKIIGDRL